MGSGEMIAASALRARATRTTYALWATYCAPCLREMADLQRMHDAGHRVVGVSLDGGRRSAAQAALRSHGGHYPGLVLDGASTEAAGRALEAGLPWLVVLDADGVRVAEGAALATAQRAVMER